MSSSSVIKKSTASEMPKIVSGEKKDAFLEEFRSLVSRRAYELFEELGVLIVRGGELSTRGQFVSLRDDLESGRMSWPTLLQHYELHLDA